MCIIDYYRLTMIGVVNTNKNKQLWLKPIDLADLCNISKHH